MDHEHIFGDSACRCGWRSTDVIAALRATLGEREAALAGLREVNAVVVRDRDAFLEEMNRLRATTVAQVVYEHAVHEWQQAIRERDAALLRCRALEEGLDIITRACEAGAYVGRQSPAVTQARALLAPADGKGERA